MTAYDRTAPFLNSPSDYYQIPDDSTLAFASGSARSFAAWVYVQDWPPDTWGCMLTDLTPAPSAKYTCDFRLHDTVLSCTNPISPGTAQDSSVSVPYRRWFHAAIVMTGPAATVEFYHDGQLVYNPGFSQSGSAYDPSNWRIGNSNGFGPSRHFVGGLDWVGLWNRRLSPDEVLAHMKGGIPFDPVLLADLSQPQARDLSKYRKTITPGGSPGRLSIRRPLVTLPDFVRVPSAAIPLDTVPFLSATTQLYQPTLPLVQAPFLTANTQLYAPSIEDLNTIRMPFLQATAPLYPPGVGDVHTIPMPFLRAHVAMPDIFSIYSDTVSIGAGNGGELHQLELAPSGTSVTATLTAPISTTSASLSLSGDGGLPGQCVLTIDDEQIVVSRITTGSWRIMRRAQGNTTVASHSAGASAVWTDSYDIAIGVAERAVASFLHTDVFGSVTYHGFVIIFDSSQAYLGGSRYPAHVEELVGVFDAGAGVSGSNRLDASQPSGVHVPAAASDDCPAAMTIPALITTDMEVGDVVVARYVNTEAANLRLGPRAIAAQTWYGLKRVDSANNNVTLTDPTGHIVDGTIEGVFHNPSGRYTTVTLPGSSRTFTHGGTPSPPNFADKGWPIAALAVRNGRRRVPYWESPTWHNFSYVYPGFATDATYVQVIINRNGFILTDPLPAVNLPGPQDISGPDATWDDETYYFATAWYVALAEIAQIFVGPTVNVPPGSPGSIPPPPGAPPGTGGGGAGGGTVTFPPTAPPVIVEPPEGGSGGNINPPPQAAAGDTWIARVNRL